MAISIYICGLFILLFLFLFVGLLQRSCLGMSQNPTPKLHYWPLAQGTGRNMKHATHRGARATGRYLIPWLKGQVFFSFVFRDVITLESSCLKTLAMDTQPPVLLHRATFRCYPCCPESPCTALYAAHAALAAPAAPAAPAAAAPVEYHDQCSTLRQTSA